MNDTSIWVILVAAIFTNNILLSHFLGLCSFLACSQQIRTALGLGGAVVFVMTATTMLNHVIYHEVLVPLGLGHLTFIVFIAVIAAFVQLVEMFVEQFSPRLYLALGIFLPLITVNCAILGACLFMVIRDYTFAQSALFGLGSGLGWMLAITLMAGIRQRLRFSNIPEPLRGLGITMLVTGVMALAMMGFTGMVSVQ